MKKLKVGVVGATGYTGEELVKLLSRHPEAEVTYVSGKEDRDEKIQDIFPYLLGKLDLPCKAFSVEEAIEKCDLVFLALPHTASMAVVPALVKAGKKVIDVSADYRLKDTAVYEKFYKVPHGDTVNLPNAVYGLPEIHRAQIQSATLVANPGCYPTATMLGFLPLVKAGCVDLDHLIADAKSGVSGAGRKTEINILFSEASDNFKAYAVPGHRHLPEIRQELARAAGKEASQIGLTFVPHLTPMIRGMQATLYARITREADFQALFEQHYAAEPFVDVLPPKSHPETRSVRAANTCRIALHRPQGGDTLVVLSVIDNLMKGAAGQAVQNMNLMFGLDECSGLSLIPVLP